MSKVVGYARVSTADQREALDFQRDTLKDSGADVVHREWISGRIKWEKRPQLRVAVDSLAEGDTLIITALDRLGRNLHSVLGLCRHLNDQGIHLKVLTLPGDGGALDTKTSTGKLLLSTLAMLAEFESDIRRDRALAGHARRTVAFGESVPAPGGRKPKLTPAQVREAKALLEAGASVSSLADQFGVSRTTIYKNVPRD